MCVHCTKLYDNSMLNIRRIYAIIIKKALIYNFISVFFSLYINKRIPLYFYKTNISFSMSYDCRTNKYKYYHTSRDILREFFCRYTIVLYLYCLQSIPIPSLLYIQFNIIYVYLFYLLHITTSTISLYHHHLCRKISSICFDSLFCFVNFQTPKSHKSSINALRCAFRQEAK